MTQWSISMSSNSPFYQVILCRQHGVNDSLYDSCDGLVKQFVCFKNLIWLALFSPTKNLPKIWTRPLFWSYKVSISMAFASVSLPLMKSVKVSFNGQKCLFWCSFSLVKTILQEKMTYAQIIKPTDDSRLLKGIDISNSCEFPFWNCQLFWEAFQQSYWFSMVSFRLWLLECQFFFQTLFRVSPKVTLSVWLGVWLQHKHQREKTALTRH